MEDAIMSEIKVAGLDMVSSLADVLRLAETLAAAKGGFIPDHFRTPAQVAAVILAGRELGVGPMASLRSFYLVNGKLGMDASFVSGRMLAHGIGLEWLSDTDECASVRLTRPGCAPYTSTFTRQDAERAGLWNSATWRKYPRAMLRARAITAGARAYAADAFSGSVYTREELSASQPDEEPRVEHVAVVEGVPATPTLEDGAERIVAALDVASTDVELAQLRAELVTPAWPTLSTAGRERVSVAGKAAKARIDDARRAIIARMNADRESGEDEAM
jgi:hypothetical protein